MAKRSKGGPKRFKKSDHPNKRSRKNHINVIPREVDDDSSSEEEPQHAAPSSDVLSEEEEAAVVYKEPSMYDNLLTTLSSGNATLAEVCRQRRNEEEGRASDDEDEEEEEEEEDDDEEEDAGVDEVEEDEGEGEEGSDDDDDGEEEPTTNEDAKTGEAEELSDTDEIDRQSGVTSSTSSFSLHLGHVLTQEEVDDLPKKKWKSTWEVPVVASPLSKWLGTGECFLNEIVDESSNYGLKSKLYEHWLGLYKSSGGSDFHSSRQRQFFSICNSYRDILHCNKRPFYHKAGVEEDSGIRDAYIVHALNHVFRSRDLLSRNETKLAKLRESNKVDSLDGAGFLDRGFTRPKVLFLFPLASIAFRLVNRLMQLTPSSYKAKVEHMDSFYKNLSGESVEENGDDDELEEPESQKSSKPSDHQALFGGNNSDSFMMGIKFTRRGIMLCSDFYTSDVIVTSAMGIINKYKEAKEDKAKEKDLDYLSSIEVLIIDHADVISMQNWSLVNDVVGMLNDIPSKQHGTDVMRIRQWYLDGHARFYRQTILLGFYLTPEINSFFNHNCLNYQGKVKSITEYKGVLPKVLLPVRQIYERFDVASIVDADDARFNYFTTKVLPKINDSVEGGTMLFISSYFEFIRIRNFLKSQNASFCLFGEYTTAPDMSRARNWFFKGERKIMLYTERVHFHYRYKIRGIKNLIIYSLPERKEFYPEIVNMLEESADMSATVLFSGLDQLRLERIVGKKNSKKMTSSEKRIFVFC